MAHRVGGRCVPSPLREPAAPKLRRILSRERRRVDIVSTRPYRSPEGVMAPQMGHGAKMGESSAGTVSAGLTYGR